MTDKKKLKDKKKTLPASLKKITPKQAQVVLETTLAKKSGREAVKAAYNVTTNDSADAIVQKLKKHPGVQQAMTDVLLQKYPDIDGDMSDLIHHGLNLWRKDDDPRTLKLCKEFLEMAAKIKGDIAPTKHQTVKANIFGKLPGSGDD